MKVNKLLKIVFSFIILFTVINVKALDHELVIEDNADIIKSENSYTMYLSNFVDMGNVYLKTVYLDRELNDSDLLYYYRAKFGNTEGLIVVYNYTTQKCYLLGIGDKYKTINDGRSELPNFNLSSIQIMLFESCAKVKDRYECAKYRNYFNYYYKPTIRNNNNADNNADNGNDLVMNNKMANDATKNPLFINKETNYSVVMDDRENLLSDEEETNLLSYMTSLTKYGNAAFVSIKCDSMTSSCANSYYHEVFKQNSGTIFMIDMNHRIIYIFSDGANYNMITDNKAEIITDNVYTYASAGDYYSCAQKAFKQIGTVLDGGKILEPMRYITNMFLALFLGFLICFVIVIITSLNKKTSIRDKRKNYIYNLALANFVATENGTTKVFNPVIDSSTGSSGFSSGGGGFSGGGFSSGGGGGFSSGGGGGSSSGGGGGHGF